MVDNDVFIQPASVVKVFEVFVSLNILMRCLLSRCSSALGTGFQVTSFAGPDSNSVGPLPEPVTHIVCCALGFHTMPSYMNSFRLVCSLCSACSEPINFPRLELSRFRSAGLEG